MKIKKYIKHPIKGLGVAKRRFINLIACSPKVSDKKAISLHYFSFFGKRMHWNNPVTFNEKLNWLKLNYRKIAFNNLVDKYEVKKIVSEKVDTVFIAKTIGVYNSPDEIDFSLLTPPFVIKTTHISGGVFVVKKPEDLNIDFIKNKLRENIAINYFYHCREWPYKNIKPRIIIEEYLQDENTPVLPVYKFFCFNGEPYLLQAIENDKHVDEAIDYYDMSWNKLDLRQNYRNAKNPLKKPDNFDQMKEIAKSLSKGFPFIRVDLYNVNGKIYFSEFTFFSDAGYAKFHPKKWDKILGEKIVLPEVVREDL